MPPDSRVTTQPNPTPFIQCLGIVNLSLHGGDVILAKTRIVHIQDVVILATNRVPNLGDPPTFGSCLLGSGDSPASRLSALLEQTIQNLLLDHLHLVRICRYRRLSDPIHQNHRRFHDGLVPLTYCQVLLGNQLIGLDLGDVLLGVGELLLEVANIRSLVILLLLELFLRIENLGQGRLVGFSKLNLVGENGGLVVRDADSHFGTVILLCLLELRPRVSRFIGCNNDDAVQLFDLPLELLLFGGHGRITLRGRGFGG